MEAVQSSRCLLMLVITYNHVFKELSSSLKYWKRVYPS